MNDNYYINSKIWNVLSKLGEQADKERFEIIAVPPEDMMLAITADTGMFFNIMLKAIKSRSVLEVGTSTGYSTLWFADALMHNTQNYERVEKSIITIDDNLSKIKRARRNFDEAGVKNIIEILEGEAHGILSKMLKDYQNNESNARMFDFVFLDADKENAIDYFELTLPMLKVGGIIAADNIIHPEICVPDMTKYANYVKNKPNVQSVTVPIGNGEEITIKIS